MSSKALNIAWCLGISFLSLTGSSAAPCFPVPEGLVAAWKGEFNCTDAVSGVVGVNYGEVRYSTGLVGFAFDYPGNGSHTRIADTPALHFTNAMSAEAWVYPRSHGVYHDVISKWDIGFNGGHSYDLAVHPDGRAYLVLCADGNSQVTAFAMSTNSLPLYTWSHLAGTYDGQSIRFYLNGVLEADVPYTAGIFPGEHDLGIGGTVGGATVGSASGVFDGLIDEPSLYSRALTAAEVASIASARGAGKCLPANSQCPFVISHPKDQLLTAGATLSLGVTAGGAPPLSYQWLKDGQILIAATNASYARTEVGAADAGTYSVLVTNSCGVALSSNAVVSVAGGATCASTLGQMVGWWPAENDATDISGANPGRLNGGGSFTNGVVGAAFVLDGVNDHIRVPDSAQLRFSNAMSIEMWIWPEAVDHYQALASKWDTVPYITQRSYVMGINPSGRAYFGISRDGTDYTSLSAVTTNSLSVRKWTHLVGSYDGRNVRIYLDGKLHSDEAYSSTAPVMQGTGDVGIGGVVGGASEGAVDYPFWGRIDEVSMYARALTEAEVKSIYEAKENGKCYVPQAPFIIQSPLGLTNVIGDTAVFSVVGGGTPPLSYQWFFNGVRLDAKTNSTLSIPSVTLENSGSYSVLLSNQYGFVLSSNATLAVLTAPPCFSAPTNLVAWWPANGNSDDAGGGTAGMLTGDTSYGLGRVAQAFSFDGVGDFVNVGPSPALQLQNLSIEAWIKRGSASFVSVGSGTNAAAQLFGFGSGGYGLFLYPDGRLAFGKVGASIQAASGLSAIRDTNWHHVAVTKAGTYLTFMVDGATANYYFGSTFTFGGPAAIGGRPDTAANCFFGLVDELSAYEGALSVSQLRSIYSAGAGGKCPAAIAPIIVTHPQNASVTSGSSVTFSVAARGTPPLAYQWYRGGESLPGAFGPELKLTNVQPNEAGSYWVTVTNVHGLAMSSPAVLTVTTPPSVIQLGDVVVEPAGGQVSIPILVDANGYENAVGFTLSFDASKLDYESTTLGSGASAGHLLLNSSESGAGRIGIAMAMDAGTTMPAGSREIVLVRFTSKASGVQNAVTIDFSDSPTVRQVAGVSANTLPANFIGGTITIPRAQYESDVAPRPDGDMSLTITDWVQAGRFVARLDEAAQGSEFQRADCAPKSSKGDGIINVNDWVQAGRFAIGLDPLAVIGGPSKESGGGGNVKGIAVLSGGDSVGSKIRISDGVIYSGETCTVSIQVEAKGNESGVSFSLAFDPTVLTYAGADKGEGAKDAAMNVNASGASVGKLGLALAMLGTSFKPGVSEIVKVTFSTTSSTPAELPVVFGDTPVSRGLSDINAESLSADYISGTVRVNPSPTLHIWSTAGTVNLSWPGWASSFTLQQATVFTADGWTNVLATPNIVGDEHRVSIPVGEDAKFYRLQR
jgi:hypothetical protein